jgi:hypothetical protein
VSGVSGVTPEVYCDQTAMGLPPITSTISHS